VQEALVAGFAALVVAAAAWFGVALVRYARRERARAAREAHFLAHALALRPGRPTAAAAEAEHDRTAAPEPGTAEEALRRAIAAKRPDEVVALFRRIGEGRKRLRLAAQEWEALGRALLAERAYLEAAWSLHAGAVLADDPVAAQKRLVEVAVAASAGGDARSASLLYAKLLERYPDSHLAAFARAQLRIERRSATR